MHLQTFATKAKCYYNCKNQEITKKAHIFQFSWEILQKPRKLLIKNEGKQSRDLLEKLTELKPLIWG